MLEGRTFGHHFLKRISFAIIPAAFVVGVITTLLAALTVVSIKGLGVGVSVLKSEVCVIDKKKLIMICSQVVLLVIALGQMLARGVPQASSYSAAPLPIVYSHHSRAEASPVWVEKDW